MGTKTTDLQKEIKRIIESLGWSVKRLAREIYCDQYDDDDEVEIGRAEEALKKSLSRNTTKVELLENYLRFIQGHEQYRKLKFVVPVYVSSGAISEELENNIYEISKYISENIDKN